MFSLLIQALLIELFYPIASSGSTYLTKPFILVLYLIFLIPRNKTSSEYVYYGLHLHFSRLYFKKSPIDSCTFKRNHVSICTGFKYIPKMVGRKKRTIEYQVDETLNKVSLNYEWIQVYIELENRQILALFQLINPKKVTRLLLKDSFRV